MATCLILSTLLGSALFAGLGEVAVGRLLVEGGHRALTVAQSSANALVEEENSALYGLAPTPDGYLAVGHVGEALLRMELDPQGNPVRALAGGRGILWGTDLRALDPPFAYGYSYRFLFQGEGMVLDLGEYRGKPLAYRLEALTLPWRPFKSRALPLPLSWKPLSWQRVAGLKAKPCP